MPVLVTCSECGDAIPSDAPEGMCPACLWRLVQLPGGPAAGADIDGDDAPADDTHSLSTKSSLNSTVDFLRVALIALPPESCEDGEPRRLPSAAGRRLGNYDLLEELGRGGMGIVYKAVQRLAGRTVAVKLVLGGAASAAADRRRFLSEVQALAKLRHPHIVPVYEVSEEDGCPYFSMEYMPGGTLSDKVRRGSLPPDEAAQIIERLAGAVHAAHCAGVLHRDIKPSNVMLDADGTPKLTDFGLAKQLDAADGPTQTGSVIGTPAYMPPEQAAGSRAVTRAADVYSLGATLYALLTGRPPFIGKDFPQTVHSVLHDDPVRPRALRREIPLDLEAVCLKALEKHPARRYPTAEALREDLARWREGTSTVARPQTWPQRAWRQARRQRRAIGFAAALLAVAALVAWALQPPDPLARIEAALTRGEKVTLIGPTGPPVWHESVLGAAQVSGPSAKTPFMVFSPGAAYLELLPRVPCERFRLTAEFRHYQSTDPSSLAGVYFARVQGPIVADSSVGRAIAAALRDDLINYAPLGVKGDHVRVQDLLMISTSDRPLTVPGDPIGGLWFKEKKVAPQDKSWRRLLIDVKPDTIRVQFWPDVKGAPLSVKPETISIARRNELDREQRDTLDQDYSELLPHTPMVQPQGGLGIFVDNAGVFFRNVEIEPLPSP